MPVTALIQGESEGTNNKDGAIKDIEGENMNRTKSAHLDMSQRCNGNVQIDKSCTSNDKSTNQLPTMTTDTPPTNKTKWRYAPFNQVTDKLVAACSRQIWMPSRYVRDIQNGVGSADNRRRKTNLPVGIRVSDETEVEGEIRESDSGQIKHAMAATISELEAIDLLSLEKMKQRLDWPRWEITICEELDALQKAGTWVIVERPKGRNIVKNKWMFEIKKDSAGKVERYHARLVAKGLTQVQGIDYYDTWAPVAKLGSIQLILAIAAQNAWPINMFNFNSAFLNGKLDTDEEVFMEQPYGYEQSNSKQYVCKLLKSLYGLKQASRKWYNALCKVLDDIGFK